MRTTQDEKLRDKKRQSDKEAIGLASASPRQMAKRMKTDFAGDLGLSEKATSLASEELNLRLRRRVLANLGRSSQNENAKIKELSAERQQIKSQLLQQSGNEAACISTLPQQAPLLPQESPLKNIMNFAKIEEEIVQMKIQYAMAEKELRRERQAVGRASDTIIKCVKAIGKALAKLYERREATQADRTRTNAFLRPASTTKAKSPASTPAATGAVVNPVSLGSVLGSEDVEIRERRSSRKQTSAESTAISINGATPDPAASRQVRFALTDIETLIQP